MKESYILFRKESERVAFSKRPNGLKSVREIQVIETVSEVGYGTEKDPVRIKTQYWDLEGNFLATKESDLLEDKKNGYEVI